jgi:hypothetical protein
VFKVLQYWNFEVNANDVSKTDVRVGLAIHYMKTSMFKSQIFGGSKEELTEQSLKWLKYAERQNKSSVEEIRRQRTLVEEDIEVITTRTTDDVTTTVRRTSVKRVDGNGHVETHLSDGQTVISKVENTPSSVVSSTTFVTSDGKTGVTQSSSTANATSEVDTETVTSTTQPSQVTGTYESVTSKGAVSATATTTATAPAATMTTIRDAPQSKSLMIILIAVIAILALFLYRQYSYNVTLAHRIDMLSRQIESNNMAIELSMKNAVDLANKFESVVAELKKSHHV